MWRCVKRPPLCNSQGQWSVCVNNTDTGASTINRPLSSQNNPTDYGQQTANYNKQTKQSNNKFDKNASTINYLHIKPNISIFFCFSNSKKVWSLYFIFFVVIGVTSLLKHSLERRDRNTLVPRWLSYPKNLSHKESFGEMRKVLK